MIKKGKRFPIQKCGNLFPWETLSYWLYIYPSIICYKHFILSIGLYASMYNFSFYKSNSMFQILSHILWTHYMPIIICLSFYISKKNSMHLIICISFNKSRSINHVILWIISFNTFNSMNLFYASHSVYSILCISFLAAQAMHLIIFISFYASGSMSFIPLILFLHIILYIFYYA